MLSVLKDAGAVSSVSGVVTFAKDGFFFLQSGGEGLKVTAPRHASARRGGMPEPGDLVEASGRPALEGGRVVMDASSWKRTGRSSLPEPRPADAGDLTFAGDGGDDVNWRRVEVVGRAMGLTENGFSLEVADGLLISVAVDPRPDFIDGCERLHPKVAVRGVAELFLDQSALFGRGRYVIGVRICAAAPGDVDLLPDAGYQMRLHEREVAVAMWSAIGLLAAGLLVLWAVNARHRRIRYSTAMVMADRKRMADDLHDTIEQHLAGAGMLLKLARLPANGLPPGAERPVKEAQDILLRAKQEMRDIVWGLKNDDMMRLPPAEMLRQLAAGLTRKGMVRVRTRLDGLPERMDGGAMRDLSLIVREAVGNAVRHGGAGKVAVTCDATDGGGWLLRVANDGAPFDAESAPGPSEGHFGLEGMRERARRIGASISFGRKGKWTIVSVVRTGGALRPRNGEL